MRPKRGIKFRNQISFRAKKSLHWCYLFVDSISIISVYVNGFHSVSEFLFHPFSFQWANLFWYTHTNTHFNMDVGAYSTVNGVWNIKIYVFSYEINSKRECSLYICFSSVALVFDQMSKNYPLFDDILLNSWRKHENIAVSIRGGEGIARLEMWYILQRNVASKASSVNEVKLEKPKAWVCLAPIAFLLSEQFQWILIKTRFSTEPWPCITTSG